MQTLPYRLHLLGYCLAAFLILRLFLRRLRAAYAVADVAALTLQGGKFCFELLNICLQVGCRMNTVLLQEVIVGNQLLQILFRRPQIRRQQHYIGKLGYNLNDGDNDIKKRINQNGGGVIAVFNGEPQLSQLVLQRKFLRLVRRSVLQSEQAVAVFGVLS